MLVFIVLAFLLVWVGSLLQDSSHRWPERRTQAIWCTDDEETLKFPAGQTFDRAVTASFDRGVTASPALGASAAIRRGRFRYWARTMRTTPVIRLTSAQSCGWVTPSRAGSLMRRNSTRNREIPLSAR